MEDFDLVVLCMRRRSSIAHKTSTKAAKIRISNVPSGGKVLLVRNVAHVTAECDKLFLDFFNWQADKLYSTRILLSFLYSKKVCGANIVK